MNTDFQKHEQNRTRLSEILTDPVFIEAVATVKKMHEPVIEAATSLNPVLAASRYQKVAGINALLTGLENLTKTITEPKRLVEKALISSEDQIPISQ